MHIDDIREQVQKIISRPLFVNSESLVRLLRAIVEETLAGRGDQLKEYVLGAEVLGKGPLFDPKADPIVRVQIGRLRTKLERYYQTEGRQDPILIQIPRGAYVPHFQQREAVAAHSQIQIVHTARRRTILGALIAVSVILVVYAVHRLRGHYAPVSIAVLPFSSVNSDSESRYFSEGVAE
jgi:hypothetical protein